MGRQILVTVTGGEPEPLRSLMLGAVRGSDAASTAWGRAIGSLNGDVKEADEGLISPLRVNVVYYVDSKMAPQTFSGTRTGMFSKRDRVLVIDAAVPSDADPPFRAVLLSILVEAIAEATIFARRKGIADELPVLAGLVASLDPSRPLSSEIDAAIVKLSAASDAAPAVEEPPLRYQLVLQWPASGRESLDQLHRIETVLGEQLQSDDVDFDGHDFGSGEMNIFIYTDDSPEQFFEQCRSVLDDHDHAWTRTMKAGFRREDDGDYTAIWPPGAERFDVL